MKTAEFTMSLRDAREWLRGRVDNGEHCPCCGQYAKVYKRTINAGMARALVAMYQIGGTDWLHKPTALRGLGAAARDESLLRYWDLIEEDAELREDRGRAGWWRVTGRGEQFVNDHLRVPKYARVYDGRCLELDGPSISIRDALGTHFNYADLMAA